MNRTAVVVAIALATAALPAGARANAETLPLVADAYTDATVPESRFGSSPFLRVNEGGAAAFVRFDVTALAAGSTVSRATLSLFVGRRGTPGTITIHAAAAPWTEDQLSHAARPSWTPEPAATLDVSDATPLTEPVTLDVTAAVQAWVDGAPNHGFALAGWGGVDVDIVSKEFMPDGRPMTLEVVAIAPPPAQ